MCVQYEIKAKMAENLYDEIQEIELDSTGYIKALNRSNQTQNEQQRKSIVKKPTGKRCVFLWIGIIIGSAVSGITVFSLFKYGGMFSYNGSSCLWTEWTEWTGCNSSLISGTEKRIKIYTGYANSCQQKETFETRQCTENISYCFWTEWTSWTGCSFLWSSTTQRVKIYTGYAHFCQQKEEAETRLCFG